MKKYLILVLLACTSPAWATKNCNKATNSCDSVTNNYDNSVAANGGKGGNASQNQGQNAYGGTGIGGNQHQNAFGGNQGQSSENTNTNGQTQNASSEQEQGQSQNSSTSTVTHTSQGQSAHNEGNSLSTEFNDKSRFLSLSLPGATADHGSSAPCLESRRGWTFAGNGASGRTRINNDCFAEQVAQADYNRCIALADRYASWGQVALAIQQLESCGGIEGATVATLEITDNFVTIEQLNRAFTASQSK